MERWAGKVALVTGASTGIGAAVARRLVKDGMKVVGIARHEQKMQEMAEELQNEPGSLLAIKCDVSQDDELCKVFHTIKEKFGGVDICVNNAGNIIDKSLLDASPEDWRLNLNVNVVALCLCSKLAVHSMKERNAEGHIINISSIFAHYVAPQGESHFYAGTKHAVKAISEGLRKELRQRKLNNIRVSCISPGIVKTEFFNTYLHGALREACNNGPGVQADDIATLIVKIIAMPPHVEVNDVIIRPTELDWITV